MGSEGESESGLPDKVLDSAIFVKEDRLQGRTLRDIHTSFVKPATATPGAQEWLPLSQLDYLMMVYYTPLLITFTVDQIHRRFGTPSAVVQHWKASLAEALALFYPLAGRVFIKDATPRIHCNDAGAVFTEATVDADLVELRPDDFQPLPLLSGLAPAGLPNYPTLPHIPTGLPALIIQVILTFVYISAIFN